MTESKHDMVSRGITYLATDTVHEVVIESAFSLLHRSG